MANFKTKGNGPQVGGKTPDSHTSMVCLTESGGGKNSLSIAKLKKSQRRLTQPKSQKLINLTIGTYNIRSMNTDEKINELEEELTRIKWDIVGLSETRRKTESRIKLNSGNLLYYKGNEDNSNFGVGFIINKAISKHVQTIKGVSDRVAYLILKMRRTSLKIIQVYAPTSTYDDENIEIFYEDISKAMEEHKTRLTLVIGDFNAKLGRKLSKEETRIGDFGYGERNDRGTTLMNYLEEKHLYAMNSFYKKKPQRKWTWLSPNGTTKNEIDYILSTEKYIIKDVTVLNRFTTGSDHRMVRTRVCVDSNFEMKRKLNGNNEQLDMTKLAQNKTIYKERLKEQITQNLNSDNGNIDEINDTLTKAMIKVGKEIAQKEKKKENCITEETKKLMEERRNMSKEGKRKSIEYVEMNKTIRKMIKENKRKNQETKIERVIENNRNMKCLRPTLGRYEINKIKDKNGVETNIKEDIINITQLFYTELYQTKREPPEEIIKQLQNKIKNVNSELQPEISKSEIKRALKEMKNNKAPGKDGITAEMLKYGGKTVVDTLHTLLNKILQDKRIPNNWNESITIILHKKGDKTDLKNYRPITLLNVVYKLLTKILTTRLTTKFDGYQSKEQAGFRKGFSTSDHLLTMKILIERANEYHIPLYIAFIDFEKAFDSVEHWAVKSSLINSRIDYRYTDLITNIYSEATTTIKIHEGTRPIHIRRGVRQGDTISPKLFNQALEDVFKKLDWEEKGINICGQHLNNLRYADDIALITDKKEELTEMLKEMDTAAKNIGLNMNYAKTKTMTNTDEDITIRIEQEKIEQVDEYIYLGQIIKLNKENQTAEIKRRVRLGWAAFGKLSYILKNKKYPQYLKTKVYNQCVLPVLTYGSQTWTLTQKNMDKVTKAQRSMERQMLHVKLIDRKRNEWIRNKTKVRDVRKEIAKLKWKFAGHNIRQKDERWNKCILNWRPWENKRSRGRPQMRWADDLKKHAGTRWMNMATNREEWKRLGEAYVQRWTEEG